MWGNPLRAACLWIDAGPIPTCVGQPSPTRCEGVPDPAYPHVCGATTTIASTVSVYKGLSPRVWGNQQHHQSEKAHLRPIPTCVGQPLGGAPNGLRGWAYPHVCGATVLTTNESSSGLGLSPRVWGNRRRAQRRL